MAPFSGAPLPSSARAAASADASLLAARAQARRLAVQHANQLLAHSARAEGPAADFGPTAFRLRSMLHQNGLAMRDYASRHAPLGPQMGLAPAAAGVLSLLGSHRSVERLRVFASLAAAARQVAAQDQQRPLAKEVLLGARRVEVAGRLQAALWLPGCGEVPLLVPMLDLTCYAWPLLDPKDPRGALEAVFGLGELWHALLQAPVQDAEAALGAMARVLRELALMPNVPIGRRMPLIYAADALERLARPVPVAAPAAVSAQVAVAVDKVSVAQGAKATRSARPESPFSSARPAAPPSPARSRTSSTASALASAAASSSSSASSASSASSVTLRASSSSRPASPALPAAPATPATQGAPLEPAVPPVAPPAKTDWERFCAALAAGEISAAQMDAYLAEANAVAQTRRVAAFAGARPGDAEVWLAGWRVAEARRAARVSPWPATEPEPGDYLRVLRAFVANAATADEQGLRCAAVLQGFKDAEVQLGWSFVETLPRKTAEGLDLALGIRLVKRPPQTLGASAVKLADLWLRRAAGTEGAASALLQGASGELATWLAVPALHVALGRLLAAHPVDLVAGTFFAAWLEKAVRVGEGARLLAVLTGTGAASPLFVAVAQRLADPHAALAVPSGYVALLAQKLTGKRGQDLLDPAQQLQLQKALEALLTREPAGWEALNWQQAHAWTLLDGVPATAAARGVAAAVASLQRGGNKSALDAAAICALASRHGSQNVQLQVAAKLWQGHAASLPLAQAVARTLETLAQGPGPLDEAGATALLALVTSSVTHAQTDHKPSRLPGDVVWVAFERAEFFVPQLLANGAGALAAKVVLQAFAHPQLHARSLLPLAYRLPQRGAERLAELVPLVEGLVEELERAQTDALALTDPSPRKGKAADKGLLARRKLQAHGQLAACGVARTFLACLATNAAYAWADSDGEDPFAALDGHDAAAAPDSPDSPDSADDPYVRLGHAIDLLTVRHNVCAWQQQARPLQKLRAELQRFPEEARAIETHVLKKIDAEKERRSALLQVSAPILMALVRAMPEGVERQRRAAAYAELLGVTLAVGQKEANPLAPRHGASAAFAAEVGLALQPVLLRHAPVAEVANLQRALVLRAFGFEDEKEWRAIHAMRVGLTLAGVDRAAVEEGCKKAFEQALGQLCNFHNLEQAAARIQRFFAVGMGLCAILPQARELVTSFVDATLDAADAQNASRRLVPMFMELLEQNVVLTKRANLGPDAVPLACALMGRLVHRANMDGLPLDYPAGSHEVQYAWACSLAELGAVAATVAQVRTFCEDPHDGSLAQPIAELVALWQRGGSAVVQSAEQTFEDFDFACQNLGFRRELMEALRDHGQLVPDFNAPLLRRLLDARPLEANEEALFAQLPQRV